MKAREFKKLCNEKSPGEIIEDYMLGKIYLTDKQLEKVTNNGEHRGGCNTAKILFEKKEDDKK